MSKSEASPSTPQTPSREYVAQAVEVVQQWLAECDNRNNTPPNTMIAVLAAFASASVSETNSNADTARLDFLEQDIGDEPILLHNNAPTKMGGFRGLGLQCTGRTLRQAIDDMMGAFGKRPT